MRTRTRTRNHKAAKAPDFYNEPQKASDRGDEVLVGCLRMPHVFAKKCIDKEFKPRNIALCGQLPQLL